MPFINKVLQASRYSILKKKSYSLSSSSPFCLLSIDMLILPLLYKTLLGSHLEYGNLIWGPLNWADQKSIKRVQSWATKACLGCQAPTISGAPQMHLISPISPSRSLVGRALDSRWPVVRARVWDAPALNIWNSWLGWPLARLVGAAAASWNQLSWTGRARLWWAC